jgi:hypothetical protein
MFFMMLATLLFTQAPVDPTGHWEGFVKIPDSQIAVAIDLARDDAGKLIGEMAQPDENLKGLQLGDFSTEGDSVRFQVKGKAGERVFAGKISADGKTLAGEFTQGGYQMPFVLTRTGEAHLEARPKIAAIDKALEGSWRATLNSHGTDVRLVLTIANQPDGSATASILNEADGLELPVTAITQQAANLTLEIKAIGGSYTAEINKDRTELVGTFSEPGKTAPLTFQRATK